MHPITPAAALAPTGGGTPLHSAASHARAPVVCALLEAGGDPTAKDENGDTPRDAASRRGYKLAEAMLDRGAQSPVVRWERGGGARAKPATVGDAKALGNAGFAQSGVLGPLEAVRHYSDAIVLHREEAAADVADDSAGASAEVEGVLLSNRSAAHARLSQFHAALDDADAAVRARPRWGKAHGRVGAAHLGLGNAARAAEAYREGLQHEPASALLQEGLEEALQRLNPTADLAADTA